ncbi:hypothetical protein N665_0050s0077 [Sinapis alba]|nr:hypothetical protein N665_0050s0077 [Sinapis alba]
MPLKVEEENATVNREGKAPVKKVTSVVVDDTEKIISLTSDVEALKENQEILVKSITQNLGFAGGKPVAACLIYKCLLHWRSFELEETNIFDRIIQTIASAIEVPDNNQVLAYWLSNSAMLLRLLQHTFTSAAIPASRGCMGGSVVSSLDRQMQVDAKYPATLFKQQLTGFLEKMYVMIRDNLKIEIFSLLRLCAQAPPAQENWKSIVQRLSSYLNLMKANNTPPFLIRKLITQIFSFINLQILNSVLLSQDYCSFGDGEYVESGLTALKRWCVEATNEYVGSAWDELKHIRQAAGFLQAIIQKQDMTLDKITRELCPVLSIRQLYRISVMYFDDIYDMSSVSSDVRSTCKALILSRHCIDLSSLFFFVFFKPDSSKRSVPFTVEDISNSMEQVDANDIDKLSLIHQNPSFSFSLTCGEGSSS